MADSSDTIVSIKLAADTSGGEEAQKSLEGVRKEAVNLGKETARIGNGAKSFGDQAGQAFGKVKSAAGMLKSALSGLGFASILTGFFGSVKTLKDSFGHAKKAADDFAASVRESAQAEEIDKLSESYNRLTKAIRDSASANEHRLAMISREVEAERDLEDAMAEAAEQRELAEIDPDDPDAEEARNAISARYAAAARSRSAARAKENIIYKRQELNSQAETLDASARRKTEAADADTDEISKLEKRLNEAKTRSVVENKYDDRDGFEMIGTNAKRLLSLDWGRLGDTRTDEGDAERAKANEEVKKLEEEIKRLKKSRDEKLESASDDRVAAKRKRDEAAAEDKRIEAADIRKKTAFSAGLTSTDAADRKLEKKQEQISSDQATIAGAAGRKAEIQAKIDAEKARLQAASERANKEDRDAYLAQKRLEQGDIENRGKGWNRYVQGDRKELESDVRREENEAAEARVSFEKTKTAVEETLKKLNEEMRKFNADLERAKSRMNISSDNGDSQ